MEKKPKEKPVFVTRHMLLENCTYVRGRGIYILAAPNMQMDPYVEATWHW